MSGNGIQRQRDAFAYRFADNNQNDLINRLEQESHPLRGDMLPRDQDRLNDIFMKRMRMQRQYDERRQQTAAFGQDLINRLHGEFHDWWETASEDPTDDREWEYYGDGSPLNSWAHIERFMADRYPAAHKNQFGGNDEARPNLLNETRRNRTWGGPEEIGQHGYDPAEIAAGMLVLHNRAHANPPYNDEGDSFGDFDMGYLTRAFDKRQQMQRAYEQRQANSMVRLAADITVDFLKQLGSQFDDWMGNEPGSLDGVDHWPNIEGFFEHHYPEAHRGFRMGLEEARPLVRGEENRVQRDYPKYFTAFPRDYDADKPYETGPEAESKYGYDPKNVAAGMVLLHNMANNGEPDSWGGNRDEEIADDVEMLNDIFQKRMKMQRVYDSRTAPKELVTAYRTRTATADGGNRPNDWEDPVKGGPQTLYRGLVVPSPVDLEGLARSVGRNWTTDDDRARYFSDPFEYEGIPSIDTHGYRGGEGPFVGVNFEGEWDGDPDSVDHDWQRVHYDEDEVRLKPGTPINVTRMHYVYPDHGWDDENVLADGPRDFHAHRTAMPTWHHLTQKRTQSAHTAQQIT